MPHQINNFSPVHDIFFGLKKSNNYKFYPDQIRVPHDKKLLIILKNLKGSGFGDTDLNVGGKNTKSGVD